MVIQHNLSASSIGQQNKNITANYAKSSEKLSSGYRINRAADDSAGLSISEKMRYQIRGLERAANNIQDGMSMTEIADGALSETHSILQRIRTLAVQASNDSNSEADRLAIQNEINQLAEEVDHIAFQTNFNEAIHPLLGGAAVGDEFVPDPSYASVLDRYAFIKDDITGQATGGIGMYIPGMTSYAGAIGGYGNNGHALIAVTLPDGTKLSPISMFQGDSVSGTVTTTRTVTDDLLTFEYEDTSNGVHFKVNVTCEIVEENDPVAMKGGQYFMSSFEITNLGTYFQSMDILLHTDPINGAMGGSPTYNGASMGGQNIGEKINPDSDYSFVCSPGSYSAYTNCDVTAKFTGDHITNPPDVAYAGSGFKQSDYTHNMDLMHNIYNGVPTSGSSPDYHFGAGWVNHSLNTGASFTASTMFGLSYPVTYGTGDTHLSPDGVWIQSGFRDGDGLHIPLVDATAATLHIKDPYPDVRSHEKATAAITVLDTSIEMVSAYRSQFGAYQNALAHINSNVVNTAENTQTAESLIRDTDMSAEMMAYSKYQILLKSSESLLAQANQASSSVLELLQ